MTNHALPITTELPTWFVVALGEAGVQEIAGSGTNARIARYLQTCHLPATVSDETPWCSAFVNWCMDQAGIQGTRSAAARSWEHWGMPVPEASSAIGDLVVLWRESRTSGKGHVAFKLRVDGSSIWLWGGNQGNRVGAAPYPRDQIIGFRRASWLLK